MTERKMILQMLNEGKITVEEAERLLHAVHDPNPKAPHKGKEEKKHSSLEKEPSASQKIGKFIDQVSERIKNVDFDFNFGPHEEIQYVFEANNVSFDRVDIDIRNGSIKVIPWEKNDVRIECKAAVYKVPEEITATTKFQNETFFDCEAPKLRFYARDKTQKVNAVFFIPEIEYENMKLTTFNGPIKVHNIKVKELETKSTIGNLIVESCTGQKIQSEANHGSMTLKDNRWIDMSLETINGPVRFSGEAENAMAETINGTIYFEQRSVLKGNALLKTVTGKIEAELPEDIELEADLKTYVGSIHCDFTGMEIIEEKKELAKKTLHFIANKDTFPKYQLEAEAKTGSITVSKRKLAEINEDSSLK
ncbi:DUF4097 family beta strand repeat-containing protein [Fictibacillus gelatini]|uniref:DUF4097 family beta strand repeat-containing protein n=1 Tax=Fictibacillus gelatini TaxID=225985 RepID=UPI0003F831B4|nr:DUF4097 family beta strand repeat-containing protein [Fictibacillus gelatini]